MIQDDAALKRVELLLGLVTKEDVIAWADEAITRLTTPRPVLFDVSLGRCRTEKDLASLLGQLSQGFDPAEVGASAFRRFSRSLYHNLESGRLTPDEAASRLYRVAHQTELLVPDQEAEFCDWVGYEFALVRQGIKERTPAEEALLDFLRKAGGEETA